MPTLTKEEYLAQFLAGATNSSHWVNVLANLEYFKTAHGWVFAYTRVFNIALVALEPLSFQENTSDLLLAQEEFLNHVQLDQIAFVGINNSFASLLLKNGYQQIRVAQEPWVYLFEPIPKGNTGKGVRAARNQAIHHGVRIEEWNANDVVLDEYKREAIQSIYQQWKNDHILYLSDFLQATDPFAHSRLRRYFVALSGERAEAYLIASPIPGTGTYFLEDLIKRSDAPRGCGELITTEALKYLQDANHTRASLGVIAGMGVEAAKENEMSPLVHGGLKKISKLFSVLYQAEGLKIYRKRFKPVEWKPVYISAKNKNNKPLQAMDWLKILAAVGVAFKPKLQITPHWLMKTALTPFQRYPLTLSYSFFSVLAFWKWNHYLELPQSILERWSFMTNAPLLEWPLRSFASDFLYFDQTHFLTTVPFLIATLIWSERKHKKSFLIPLVLGVMISDDVLDYLLILKPYEVIQPSVFQNAIGHPEVGGSLLLTFLLGLQICQFKHIREIVFAILSLCILLGVLLSATVFPRGSHFVTALMNIDHLVFLILGFIAGKLLFEYRRKKNQKASKGRSPSGG